jgi:integrase
MRALNPIKQSTGGYIVRFRHPLQQSRVVNLGLATTDEQHAQSICRDALLLFKNPQILQAPTAENVHGYDAKAVEIVFGKERAKELLDSTHLLKRAITAEDAIEVSKMVNLHQEFVNILKTSGAQDAANFEKEGLAKLLEEFTPKNYALMLDLCQRQADTIKLQDDKIAWLESELQKISKKTNVQVKATVSEAFEIFKKQYVKDVGTQTFNENRRYIESFIESLSEKGSSRIALIDNGNVDHWILALKGEDGADLKPRTVRNRRNAVSKFFTWCRSKYRLSENPVDACLPIQGIARSLTEIRAIDRLSDLKALFKALETESYWQTWVMVACLAGPRFSEQCKLKISDVYFDEDGDYLRIVGKKTGRVRKVGIEKTLLKPVLKSYYENRLKEQKETNATDAQKSEYLFPTLVQNKNLTRTKTDVGPWSHNSSFSYNLSKLITRVGSAQAKQAAQKYIDDRQEMRRKAKSEKWDAQKRKANKVPMWETSDFWSYGSAEWRHTFGTALAHTGFTSLEISRFMGNSPTVADRHYIKSASHGTDKRWDLQW